mgnify:CR=1 FL=1
MAQKNQLSFVLTSISRIQTLYLLLSIVALALSAVFPIAKFYGDFSYILKIFTFKSMSDMIPDPEKFIFNLPIVIIWAAIIIMNLITIFLFNKRRTQMNLLSISIGLVLAMIALIFFYYSPNIEKHYNVVTEYNKCAGIYMPLISFVCMILAYRNIRKDDKLVKSLDRIR